MSEHCPECGWVFRSREELQRHRQAHHGVTPESPPPGPVPEVGAAGAGEAPVWLVVAGYLSAVLVPVVGLVVGVVLMVRRRTTHGIAVLAISLAVGVATFLAVSGNEDQRAPHKASNPPAQHRGK